MAQKKAEIQFLKERIFRRLRLKMALTWLMLWIERLVQAAWPMISLALLLFAILRFQVASQVSTTIFIISAAIFIIGLIWSFFYFARLFKRPRFQHVVARLDSNEPQSPLQSLNDELSLHNPNPETEGLWQAHLNKMAARAEALELKPSQIRLASVDRYALRLIAIFVAVAAILFGAGSPQDEVEKFTLLSGIESNPTSFEAWIEPPDYTKSPVVYLNDVSENDKLEFPAGSNVLLRIYGEDPSFDFAQTVSSDGTSEIPEGLNGIIEHRFLLEQSGFIEMKISETMRWDLLVLPDFKPQIQVTGPMTRSVQGGMRLPFYVEDDYGIVSGELAVELDLNRVDRRFGLSIAPEPRENLSAELPLPFTGPRDAFEGSFEEDFAKHPFAGLPVIVNLKVWDAIDQEGKIAPLSETLAFKRFFDPLAGAVAEMRRDLLWNRKNAKRSTYILRALTHDPETLNIPNKPYLMIRSAIRRMEISRGDALSNEDVTEVAELLWNAATILEEGDLSDAKERLRRAQERLSEAMENGATNEEIAELMQELRDATQDYIRQLAENAEKRENQQQSANQPQTGDEMTEDQLQQMMDRIQELMEQGRMEEAQDLLRQLQEMMENMRVVEQEQNGQGGQSQQQQLQDTLRQQQDLADDTFRQLQDEFNQEGNNQEGQNPQEGQQESQQGQEGGQDGPGQFGQNGQEGESDLAQRQRALRDMLERQGRTIPQDGSEAGENARRSLEQSRRNMEEAEENIRNGNLGQALTNQAEALESMRQGLQSLDQQQRQAFEQGGEGEFRNQEGAGEATGRDPLGRPSGTERQGSARSDRARNEGLDAARRRAEFERLLNNLKERSQETDRPEFELDYLKRLLERF